VRVVEEEQEKYIQSRVMGSRRRRRRSRGGW
jgi:hypothetical protein